MKNPRILAALATVLIGSLALTGCASGTPDTDESAPTEIKPITTIRLGYFPNLTHAAALVGIQQGHFKTAFKELAITVTPTIFNAGPDAVSALFGGSLDCTYIGPNPAINAYAQSQGAAVRVVAGASSAGAALVVKPEVNSAADLSGKTLATPQLGNTQDVALRAWLKEQGFETTSEGGGDVSILPQSNAEGLAAFISGAIDGAWVPEPWVQEYVAAGAKILLNEKELWPNGEFVTAHIICRTDFIRDYPEAVAALLRGHLASLDSIANDPVAAKQSFALALSAITGSSPKPEILDAAWNDLTFTYDPISTSLVKSAEDAISVGLLDSAQIEAAGGLPGKLYDLSILNSILKELGKAEVK
ncbi:MAG: ABC transporter substrate-binding protein [Actinomycetota bacterium]